MTAREDRPGPFFDPTDRRLFPFVPTLERNFAVIREEMRAMSRRDFLLWPTAGGVVGEWRIFPLLALGEEVNGSAELCPRTMALVRAIPGVQSAGFSRLLPGTHITPHRGFTNVVLRYHLTLDAPAGCSFDIGGERRAWRAGQSWIFDDTFEHEARNDGDRPRTILLLDFLRPAPLGPNPLKRMVKRMLFRHHQRRSVVYQAREQVKQQRAAGEMQELDHDAIAHP